MKNERAFTLSQHKLRLSPKLLRWEPAGRSTGRKQFSLIPWSGGLPSSELGFCRCANATDPDRACVLPGLDRSGTVIGPAATALTLSSRRVIASGVACLTVAGSSRRDESTHLPPIDIAVHGRRNAIDLLPRVLSRSRCSGYSAGSPDIKGPAALTAHSSSRWTAWRTTRPSPVSAFFFAIAVYREMTYRDSQPTQFLCCGRPSVPGL
jgi:hypothetical protein